MAIMAIFNSLKKWKEIRMLEKEKKHLVRQIPLNLMRRFLELRDEIEKQNGPTKEKLEFAVLGNQLKKNGVEETIREIKKIDEKISKIKKE